MSNISHVGDDDFDAVVLSAKTPVLVEFGATWCGPCRMQQPVLEQLADEQATKLKVVAIDLDEAPRIAGRYAVKGAPTLLVFKAGVITARQLGVANKKRLLEMVNGGGAP